ncbi:MAG: hypothetical protein JSS82_20115 [Bacteroidetes bacterium]|nr:hypothetical protein [Bacteroidota bacterium]
MPKMKLELDEKKLKDFIHFFPKNEKEANGAGWDDMGVVAKESVEGGE